MSSQVHVIGRQVLELELELELERDAYTLSQQLGGIFRTKVVPAMEALFDRYVPEDLVLRLDRLEIDLGRLSHDRLEENFAARVCEALETQLADHLHGLPATHKDGPKDRLSRDDHVLSLWHHVLLHGYLPWWAPPASMSTLESSVLEVMRSRDKLPPSTVQLLREHPVATRRLILQHKEALVERVLQLAAPDVAAVGISLFDALARLVELRPLQTLPASALQRHLWQAALEEGLRPTSPDPQVRLRVLLRAAFEDSAQSASMMYRELLSQLHAGLQPVASQAAATPEVSKQIRNLLLPLLSGEDTATGEIPTANVPRVGDESGAEAPGNRGLGPPLGQARDAPRQLGQKAGKNGAVPSDESGESDIPGERTDVTAARPRAEGAAHLIKTETRRAPATSEAEALYVDDAGIVLLHPFLAAHFEKLGLQRDGAFLDDDTRERAVHQLRFLATGEEEAPEPLLVIEKILCGLSPDAPIARWIPLDERAKADADVLLRAVIHHWGALKNTSPDGLRETFLRREGRLERKDDGWKLQVEARSYDLLLDRLPWNRSIVRLPWMAGLLWVEWG